ncbi:hypothetical protein SDC9_75470 [bioreactor metagenome]|uniref:Uncharacterized protein n=1 Tax=bioreactor metagenome TaxID=1076179 RepID=A0A644YJV9_9ZZZZ
MVGKQLCNKARGAALCTADRLTPGHKQIRQQLSGHDIALYQQGRADKGFKALCHLYTLLIITSHQIQADLQILEPCTPLQTIEGCLPAELIEFCFGDQEGGVFTARKIIMTDQLSQIGQHLVEEHRIHLPGRTGHGDADNLAVPFGYDAPEAGCRSIRIGDCGKALRYHGLLLIGSPDTLADARIQRVKGCLVTYQRDVCHSGDNAAGQIVAGGSKTSGKNDNVTRIDALLQHFADGPVIGNQDHAINPIPQLRQLAGKDLAVFIRNDAAGQFSPDNEECRTDVGHVLFCLLFRMKCSR